MVDFDPVERVLVVVAHPDDIDFGFAGSIATWVKAGIAVTYCLVTSGDAGGSDLTQSYEARAALREREQNDAASEFGVVDIRFLRFADGKIESNLELRAAICRVIRQVRPQRVVTQSAVRDLDRMYPSHPDHLAVGDATLAAVYPDSRNPFAFPELLADEGLEPWTVQEVWLPGGAATPEYCREVVDITETFDLKMSALRAHRSQTGHRDGLEMMLREWSTNTATDCGLPEGRLAEAFRKMDCR